jgi:uncharacterized protein DUF5916/cellulose/xylan binding protein with CBM9 domain
VRNRSLVPVLCLGLAIAVPALGQPVPEPTPAPTPVAPSAGGPAPPPPAPVAPSSSPGTPAAPGTAAVPPAAAKGAPPAPARIFRVTRADGPIRVDAVLDEATWAKAEKFELAYETFPGDNLPARAKTSAQVAFDGENLYVAFHAEDPEPGKIRAHLSDRDKAFSDDFVGIVLDTFNDERRGFEFFVNPLGVQMDLSINDVGGGEDETWDALWNAAGRITPSGYFVEMAIPFTSLRFPRAAGERTWGMDLLRVYPRGQRYIHRTQRQDRNRNCYLCQVSKLAGLQGITPGRNIELDPTLTAERSDFREDFPSGQLEEGDIEVEPGLTARWGMTPNLTLNAAINPDFSQVEADVAQLDVNTQFALFFPEKRPLFLEGADFFETPLSAVYTRTVADPEWALKLTGKEGKSALGFFVSRDNLTNLIIPGSQGSALTSFDEKNTSGVLRYRYDIGKSSTLGAIYAGRDGDDYSNHVAGADAYFRVTPRDTVQAQLLGSRTRYPEAIVTDFEQPAGEFEDAAFYFDYRHSTRNWFWRAGYTDIGEDFRADSGFLPQVGYRRPIIGMERTWWGGKEDWYSRFFVGGDWDRTIEQTGQELEEEWEGYVGVGGPLQSFGFLGGGYRDVFFNGVQFQGHKFVNFFFEIRPVGDFYFGIDGSFGDRVDFANTREGDRLLLIPQIRWNLGRHVKFELDHTYETLDVQGGRLFTANLTQLRVIYQFDIRTFVRAILQYTDISRATALYDDDVDPKTERLFSQLLLAYKINPQTVFFIGYSDTRLGDERIDLKQENRTLFVKLGYAWLL